MTLLSSNESSEKMIMLDPTYVPVLDQKNWYVVSEREARLSGLNGYVLLSKLPVWSLFVFL